MRIIRSSGPPAVVLVKGRGLLAVSVPEGLSSHEVMELASLVLSTSEYEEFRHAVEPAASRGIRVGAGLAHLGRPRDTPRRASRTGCSPASSTASGAPCQFGG
jgi:hypothetical protein